MPAEYQVALVEDTQEDADTCTALLEKYAQEKGLSFAITRFHNGETFLTQFKSQFDFIILDVELGDRNGIDVAKIIRETDNEVILMFVTYLAKYAANGYEVSAIDYALKPLKYPSFCLKLDRVVKRLASIEHDPIVVRTETGFEKLDLGNTFYIEVFGHDVIFHLSDKTVKTYGTLKKFEEMLAPHYFLRCNSCYLVNAAKIESIVQYDIVLSNGQSIKISHPKKKDFVNEFKHYILKKGRH